MAVAAAVAGRGARVSAVSRGPVSFALPEDGTRGAAAAAGGGAPASPQPGAWPRRHIRLGMFSTEMA